MCEGTNAPLVIDFLIDILNWVVFVCPLTEGLPGQRVFTFAETIPLPLEDSDSPLGVVRVWNGDFGVRADPVHPDGETDILIREVSPTDHSNFDIFQVVPARLLGVVARVVGLTKSVHIGQELFSGQLGSARKDRGTLNLFLAS